MKNPPPALQAQATGNRPKEPKSTTRRRASQVAKPRSAKGSGEGAGESSREDGEHIEAKECVTRLRTDVFPPVGNPIVEQSIDRLFGRRVVLGLDRLGKRGLALGPQAVGIGAAHFDAHAVFYVRSFISGCEAPLARERGGGWGSRLVIQKNSGSRGYQLRRCDRFRRSIRRDSGS
jgi:hypothetical protein